MTLGQILARQFSNPTGLLAGMVLPRLWNRRNKALNNLTLAHLDLHPSDCVLEVGCGGGYMLGRIAQTLKDCALAGVDVSEAMLAHCRRRLRRLVQSGRLELLRASAEALPFKAQDFTRLCTVNTIFYFPSPAGAMAEFWRILVPGGLAVVCFTRKEDLQDRSFAQHGLNLFTTQEVKTLMEEAGFYGVRLHPGADRHRRFVCAVGEKH